MADAPLTGARGARGLEREGRMDQAGAAVKNAAETAKDKVSDVVDAAKDKLSR